MKVWQKILLQAGIFTSVFALGAGTGFILNYHYVEDEQPTSEGHAIIITDPDTPHIETPTEKFLNSLGIPNMESTYYLKQIHPLPLLL